MQRPAGHAGFSHGSSVGALVAGGVDPGFSCDTIDDLSPDPDQRMRDLSPVPAFLSLVQFTDADVPVLHLTAVRLKADRTGGR